MEFTAENRRGISLLEVVLVLSVIAITFVGLSQFMADSASATRAKASAQKLEQIAIAAEAYANANNGKIEDWFNADPANTLLTIPVAKQTAIGASPSGTPGFQSLQVAGFLPSGFIDQNAAGQSHAVLVKRMPAGLEMLVVAHGGQEFSDVDLGRIASQIGAAGGAVYSNGVASPVPQILGTSGGWSYAANAWVGTLNSNAIQATAGRPAVALSMVASNGEAFLSRVTTGNPADTTMSAALNMGNNPVENARSMNVNGTIIAGQQIDSHRYVWSREGLYTEGNVWSRGGLQTEGSIAASGGIQSPRARVDDLLVGRICDLNGSNCRTLAQLLANASPPTTSCRTEQTTVYPDRCGGSASCPAGWTQSGVVHGPGCSMNNSDRTWVASQTGLICVRQVCS